MSKDLMGPWKVILRHIVYRPISSSAAFSEAVYNWTVQTKAQWPELLDAKNTGLTFLLKTTFPASSTHLNASLGDVESPECCPRALVTPAPW